VEKSSNLSDRKAKEMANQLEMIGQLHDIECRYLSTEDDSDDVDDDLMDLRSQLVCAVGVYRTSRFNLGEALYRYREAIPHGAWGDVVQAIATASNLTDRTIREILSDYERIKGTPAPLVKALQSAGIDPAAKRQAKVVDIAAKDHQAGSPPDQAVASAVAATRQRPVQASVLPAQELTKEEKLIWQIRLGIRKGLEKVDQNKKLEYLQRACAEEITALLDDQAREFVVTPTKPTLDLMGRKRSA
jgi:hypothetical protein